MYRLPYPSIKFSSISSFPCLSAVADIRQGIPEYCAFFFRRKSIRSKGYPIWFEKLTYHSQNKYVSLATVVLPTAFVLFGLFIYATVTLAARILILPISPHRHHLLSCVLLSNQSKLAEKKRPRQEASNLEYISQRELPVGDLSCMSGLIIRRLSIGRSRNYKACFISPLQSPDTCFLIQLYQNSYWTLTNHNLMKMVSIFYDTQSSCAFFPDLSKAFHFHNLESDMLLSDYQLNYDRLWLVRRTSDIARKKVHKSQCDSFLFSFLIAYAPYCLFGANE